MRVRFGQLSDFAEAILREKPELPVVRGDMPDTWIHGIGSMPIETQLAHATRPRIAALEALDTLLGIVGRAAGVGRARSCAMPTRTRSSSASTPGGPSVSRYAGYALRRGRGKSGWPPAITISCWKDSTRNGPTRTGRPTRCRAGACGSGWPPWPPRCSRGRRVVVFNPLPWTRDAAVDVPWSGDARAWPRRPAERRCRRPSARTGGCGSWPPTCRRWATGPSCRRRGRSAASPPIAAAGCVGKRPVPRDARPGPLRHRVDRRQEDGPGAGRQAIALCPGPIPLRAIRLGAGRTRLPGPT